MTPLDERDLIPLAPPRRDPESLFTYQGTPGPQANACDAPFPEEHQLLDEGPNATHHAWIPPTDPRNYLDGLHALNLRSPEVGSPGDWHPHVWECRVREPRWDAHYASTSARRGASPWQERLREWLGTREQVDARPALKRIGHPAAHRDTAVWCATHVRVVLEQAYDALKHATPEERWNAALRCQDPKTTARWLGRRRNARWERLHALAAEIEQVLCGRPGAPQVEDWRRWRVRQTPRAQVGQDERWDEDVDLHR